MNSEDRKLIEAATQNDVAAFFETVAQAPKSALLLDYDGTLAPFRVERDKATPYPGVTAALQEILSNTRTQMFIVTGRKTDDIVSLLGVYPYPVIWGLHGAQRRNPNGAVEMTCVDEDLVQALMEADGWLQAARATSRQRNINPAVSRFIGVGVARVKPRRYNVWS